MRDPEHYLQTDVGVERLTGLDFFYELDDGLKGPLEAATHATLWD